jgi:hypothetical protein
MEMIDHALRRREINVARPHFLSSLPKAGGYGKNLTTEGTEAQLLGFEKLHRTGSVNSVLSVVRSSGSYFYHAVPAASVFDLP